MFSCYITVVTPHTVTVKGTWLADPDYKLRAYLVGGNVRSAKIVRCVQTYQPYGPRFHATQEDDHA